MVYGNNSANRIDLGLIGKFDEVLITMGGSGGIDRVTTNVPEPNTLALCGLGLAALTSLRRRFRAEPPKPSAAAGRSPTEPAGSGPGGPRPAR